MWRPIVAQVGVCVLRRPVASTAGRPIAPPRPDGLAPERHGRCVASLCASATALSLAQVCSALECLLTLVRGDLKQAYDGPARCNVTSTDARRQWTWTELRESVPTVAPQHFHAGQLRLFECAM